MALEAEARTIEARPGEGGAQAVDRDAWRCFFQLVFCEASAERMHDACEAVGLTPGLMRALLSLRPGQPKPMKPLAAEWRCDASYVTSLVDGLEERGFAERRVSPHDRRAKVVVLTDAGQRAREELLAHLHQPPAFFSALTAQERRTLRDLLAKLVAAAGSPG